MELQNQPVFMDGKSVQKMLMIMTTTVGARVMLSMLKQIRDLQPLIAVRKIRYFGVVFVSLSNSMIDTAGKISYSG